MGRFGWTVTDGRAVFHRGILFRAAGEAVGAGPGGRVLRVDPGAGGSVVLLRRGSATLRIGPLAAVAVRAGERVLRGARLGRAGKVPLGVEVTVRGFPVNPVGPGHFSLPGGTR